MIRKISEPPIEVRNYWLEGHIEKETGKSVDGTDDVWQFDQRMKIVEPLIRETAEFGVEICDPERRPSILSEGEVALECIEGRYDLLDARYWVFSHLYGHAICQANSIYSLFSHSYVSQGFQLWRSLFEAHVICEFLSRHLSNSILFQDYIAHTLLRSWIRTQKGANAICKKNGQQPRYDISEIAKCEKLYRSKSWKMGEEYAWANSVVQRKSEKQRIVFRYFLDQVDSDMSELYRISSMELHSTLGANDLRYWGSAFLSHLFPLLYSV